MKNKFYNKEVSNLEIIDIDIDLSMGEINISTEINGERYLIIYTRKETFWSFATIYFEHEKMKASDFNKQGYTLFFNQMIKKVENQFTKETGFRF